MKIRLEDEQLKILETALNKLVQSFDKFSENTKELTLAIEKLTEEIKTFKPLNP